MRLSVVLTDGDQRACLAVARSLGVAGHTVRVTASRKASLAGGSRYVAGEELVPDALRRPRENVAALACLARRSKADVLIPITDASFLGVLGAAASFEGVRVPGPDLDVFRRIADKSLVLARAEELGIPTPSQVVLHNADDLKRVTLSRLSFPVVAKPARSVVEYGRGGFKKLGVEHVAAPTELDAVLAKIPLNAYPVMLQERIRGPGVGLFVLRWKDETLAIFSHRRIREKPPSGGVSVYREAISPDPLLVDWSVALLSSFGWEGVAMVEFKIDACSGRAFLMEVNGRFWGSLQLAIDAGVDFPGLLVEACCGGQPEPVLTYDTSVRSRWLWGDVDHLVARLRYSKRRLDLPKEAPGKLGACRDFFRAGWAKRDRYEVLRRGDLRPFIRESADWLGLR